MINHTISDYQYIGIHSDTKASLTNAMLLSHGKQTARAVVLLHGLTATPEQLASLGRQFFARGDNVLIPCMPYHGLPDRMTRSLELLTNTGLRAYAAQAVETAQGLGEQVSVMGFSTGGVLAAWLAMEHNLHHVTAVAPIFGLALLPAAAHPAIARLMKHLPNLYIWWDPIRRAKSPYLGDFGYPGFPLHTLNVVMQLGLDVYQQAIQNPPLAKKVTFVLNELEPAVNNRMASKVAQAWQGSRGENVQVKLLERQLHLRHDFFMPVCEHTDRVCSRLVEWMGS